MKCPNCGLDKSLYTTICDCGFDFESEVLESLNKKRERTMKCPSCGLTNHPDAIKCDCGFNFNKNVQELPVDRQTHKHPRYSQSSENIRLTRGLSCPKCDTITRGRYSGVIWLFTILLFPIGLLLLLVKKTYSCSKCGYTFKA
tara:strand:- start:418 stop:846 length:429 start_codon:yes stop_codon:yes gene_type:complete